MDRRGLQWLALTAAAVLGLAAVAAAELEPPDPTLVATGRATIYHDDVAGARERAVQAALVRGLERYGGLRIEASTLIKKGELIDREVRAHTHGYVRSFEVVESRRDGAELVVTVRLTVAEQPMAESFRRLMSATTTLLLVREANLGQPVAGQILPAILADPFFTSQLVVPSPEQLAAAGQRLPEAFFKAPDAAGVKELGLRMMAGVLIVAWADTRQMASDADALGYEVDAAVTRPVVTARGNLTILSGQTGHTLASHRFDDVRAADATDVVRAGREALHQLAARMREFVVVKLTEYVAELGFPLRVVVRGDAAREGARRVAGVLAATRWVDHVELVRETAGEAILQATCREKPLYVVQELRQAPELRVVRFDAAAAEVEVR